jgi:hypothetical protein
VHGANVVTKAAPDTIFFTDARLGPGVDCFLPAVGAGIIRIRGNQRAVGGDKINALVGSVVARHVT